MSLYITGRLEKILSETRKQAGKLGYYHCSRLGLCLAVVGHRTCFAEACLCGSKRSNHAPQKQRGAPHSRLDFATRGTAICYFVCFPLVSQHLVSLSPASSTSDCHRCDRRYTPGLPPCDLFCYASGSTERVGFVAKPKTSCTTLLVTCLVGWIIARQTAHALSIPIDHTG